MSLLLNYQGSTQQAGIAALQSNLSLTDAQVSQIQSEAILWHYIDAIDSATTESGGKVDTVEDLTGRTTFTSPVTSTQKPELDQLATNGKNGFYFAGGNPNQRLLSGLAASSYAWIMDAGVTVIQTIEVDSANVDDLGVIISTGNPLSASANGFLFMVDDRSSLSRDRVLLSNGRNDQASGDYVFIEQTANGALAFQDTQTVGTKHREKPGANNDTSIFVEGSLVGTPNDVTGTLDGGNTQDSTLNIGALANTFTAFGHIGWIHSTIVFKGELSDNSMQIIQNAEVTRWA